MIDEIRSMRDRPTPFWVIVCGLLGWLAAMVQVGFLNKLPILGAGAELVLAVVDILPATASASRVNLPGGRHACRRERRLVIE